MERPGRIAVFLQVRINSTRLPGKALKKIYKDITAAGSAMIQLKKVKADCHVLLTDAESCRLLKEETDLYGFDLFIGDGKNVLNRFTSAARFYNAGTVIRATGDNPFVFYEKAQKILDLHIERKADHSIFTGMPLGGGVEVVEAEALYTAGENTQSDYDREHVTPYIYNHPEFFKLCRIESEPDAFYPEGRITMDTENDYIYLKRAASELKYENACNHLKIIQWLKKNPHPDVS